MKKRILTVLLCVVMLAAGIIPVYAASFTNVAPLVDAVDDAPVSYAVRKIGNASTRATATAADSRKIDNDYVETSKTVIYDPETKTYKLKLETYVTGETIIEDTESRIPADIVLVMDHSSSMYDCIICNKSIDPVVIYADDLDEDTVYYRGSGEVTGAVHYCASCNGWYADRHKNNYHGGMLYLPKRTEQNEYFRQFYSRYANVNCGSSCTHANYKHPIYKGDLDKTQVYYRTAGSGNDVVYCATCDCWYNNSSSARNTHSTGNHKTDRYFPYWVADNDLTAAIDKFYVPKVCPASATGELHYPRYIALQEAVNTFLESIVEDSKGKDGVFGTADDVSHRVAATSFAGDSGGTNSTNCILTFYDPNSGNYGDGRLTGPKIPFNQVSGYDPTSSTSENLLKQYYYQNSLQDVTRSDERAILDMLFASNRLSSQTHTYKGMRMAKHILDEDNTYTDDVYAKGERNRVVVVFTDGVPYGEDAWDNSNTALAESKIIKNDLGATVYTVATFEGADGSNPQNIPSWSGNTINKANRFMHLLSSNFPNAAKRDPSSTEEATNDAINPDLKSGDSYYLSAGNAEALSNIFQKIYEQIQAGGANIDLDDATVLLDVVSEHFKINGKPVAYTESLKGIVNGVMQWASDGGSVGTITVNGNRVQVTGFDYSENYVGVDTNNGQTVHRGKKLVVEIPILPTSNNKGGEGMQTNTTESGIYYPNENGVLTPLENFSVPSADIPTTITVIKDIVGGDKAEFEFAASVQHLANYDGNDQTDGNYLDQIDGVQNHNFILKDNQSHVITNVAVGTTFMIAENVDLSKYNASVMVTDKDGRDITASVLTVRDGVYTIASVQPAMTITFTNRYKYTNLTVEKVVTGTDTPDQDFVFEVTKADDPTYKLSLVIPASSFVNGRAEVTVKGVLIGRYTVKELSWSSRYTLKSAKATVDTDATLNSGAISVDLTLANEKITFTNDRTDDLWLSGDCYAENYFADTGVVRKD